MLVLNYGLTSTKNASGRTMEYIITRDLLILNKENGIPSFETNSGCSWIDLTLCTSKLAQKTRRWTCGEEELNMKYSSHTKLTAFTDDLAILTYRKTLSEAEAYANSDLAINENWAWKNKMKFNASKPKAMVIRRKRNQDEIKIFFNNRSLEQVTEMKYLAIHFDSRLSFNKHIEQIADKSWALTYMLNRTAKLHWGLGHKSLKTIYEGTIVPLMSYGAPVWEGAITKHKYSTNCKAPRG
jgi:hypothetical protein